MLDGVPILGWFARLLTRRTKPPSTSVNITVHGDMVNSSVNVNLPPRSELQLESAESPDGAGDSAQQQDNADSMADQLG